MKVVITIPAYNEAKTIGHVIKDIKDVMAKERYNYKLLVVNDGSTDQTESLAKQAGAFVFSHFTNRGLAEAFRTEIKKSLKMGADIIVHTDADGQYQAKDIPRLIHEVEKGYDLVLGDRFAGGIEKMPLLKKIGNRAFSRAISKILKYKINDCQTGFRAFNRKVASLDIISNHTYTQEQILRAVTEDFKVKEIPTYFSAREGKSKLIKNPFGYAFKAWINILRVQRDYNPIKFFGSIGGSFIITGLLLGLWLTMLFFKTGKVGHLPSTVLCILLIISGLQILFFGFLADMKK
ncbi:MAG: glycosyltransferase family 2 protein [Candidatus Nanoarchaeia archaeon]|jgi:glycosyltransferase involved in cell wall biosynthesis